MRKFYLLLCLLFAQMGVMAQTITVAGQCITGTVTLNRVADENGRPAYQGTGTVDGVAGTLVSISWLPAPDNLWTLSFDGQPYFSSACLRTSPPSTSFASCSWSAVSGQPCTGGTPLSIMGTGTLPIRLSNFTATQVGSQVQLNWKTQSESNNKGFDIQRSADGTTWTSIGFVNGAGTSTEEKEYRFTDIAPLRGKNYYRLQQFDYDNNSSLSPVVVADISSKEFYVLQNTANGKYNLQVSADEPIQLTLLDLNGKKLFSKLAARGLNPIELTSYAQGIYVLQIRKGNLTLTEKLIKQ